MRIFLAENANINLSALRTEEACWIGNIQDSLAFLELSQELIPNSKVLDIGTGGGFPALPLAIVYPQVRFTGLDSIRKKTEAILRIAKAADIKNIEVIADRAEVLGHKKKHRECYDMVTARAVAPLSILLEYCTPFVKVGGKIILWKSMHIDAELEESAAAQKALSCELTAKHSYTLPGDFGTRQLLIFTKTEKLNLNYPREVGMAKREPLK